MQVLNGEGDLPTVVLFAPCWLEPTEAKPSYGLPLEAMSVAAAIAARGFRVVFFDEHIDRDYRDRLRGMRDRIAAACIWVGELYAYQLNGMIEFLAFRREAGLEFPVIAGGQLITVSPFDILKNCEGVTAFVHGVGEEVVPDVCDHLVARRDFSRIPGTAVVEGDDLTWNDYRVPAHLSNEYNKFYQLFDLGPYIETTVSIFGNCEPTFKVRLARGCGKGCRFCYHFRVRASRVDVDAALEAIDYLHGTYGVRQFTLHELDFFSDKERALALADGLASRPYDVRWFALGSVSDLVHYTEDDVRRLGRGGLHVVEMGTESGSASILARIGKRHQPDDPIAATRRFVESGIATVHNVIFGIPGETRADRRVTLKLARRLLRFGSDRVMLLPRLYQLAPRTPLGDETLRSMAGETELPENYEEVLRYRAAFNSESRFPWAAAAEESQIKDLSSYFIPMLQASEPPVRLTGRVLFAVLRGLASARCRFGFFGLPFDRLLYERWLKRHVTIVSAFAP